jgi:Flp pilus assembly protein TadD
MLPAGQTMNDEQLQSSLQHAVDLHRAGRLDQAVRLYRRVLSQAPDHPQALHLLGAALSQSGDHRSALEPLQRAVKLLPREPGAAHNLGLALKGMGRLEEAARALERALDLDPAFEPARAALAGLSPVLASRAQDEHRRDLAIAWLQRCLELRPDHAEARNNLAIALQETGRIPEARDQFRRALADAPNNPVIHSNLLFGLHHDPDAGPETRLREARSYGARRPQPETIPAPQPASGRPRAGRIPALSRWRALHLRQLQ